MELIHLTDVAHWEPVQCNGSGKSWNLLTWFDEYACACFMFRKEGWLAFWLFSYSILLLNFVLLLYEIQTRRKLRLTQRVCSVQRWSVAVLYALRQIRTNWQRKHTDSVHAVADRAVTLRQCGNVVSTSLSHYNESGSNGNMGWIPNHGQNTEALVQAPLCCWGVSFLTRISPAVFSVNQSGKHKSDTGQSLHEEAWNICSENIHE